MTDFSLANMRERIMQLENGVPDPPTGGRVECPIPNCTAFAHTGIGESWWREHFGGRHPEFADAFLGYLSETVSVMDASGTKAIYEPSGPTMVRNNYYLAFGNHMGEVPEMGRHHFKAIGSSYIVNDSAITFTVPVSAHLTHYAIADRPLGPIRTEFRPLPHPLTPKPGDQLSIQRGMLKVSLVSPHAAQVNIDRVYSPPYLSASVASGGWSPPTSGYLSPENIHARANARKAVLAPAPTPVEDLGYHMAIHPRFGWRVWVDLQDGGQWEYWRPTRKLADNTGYRRLMKEVARRERIEASRKPRTMRLKDIRGTSNDPGPMKEWDEEFNASA